jgi:hypothetical protein
MTKNARLSGRFNEVTGALEAIKQGGQAADLELAALGGSTPDADAATKGKLQLAGALGGTAALPTALGRANAAALDADLAAKGSLASVNNWTKTQTTDLAAIAYAASITLDRDTHANHVNIGALTGNLTLANPTGYTKAVTVNVWLTQDATGGRTLTLGSKIKKATGADLSLSTAANAVDFLSLVYNPTKDIWIASLAKGVA